MNISNVTTLFHNITEQAISIIEDNTGVNACVIHEDRAEIIEERDSYIYNNIAYCSDDPKLTVITFGEHLQQHYKLKFANDNGTSKFYSEVPLALSMVLYKDHPNEVIITCQPSARIDTLPVESCQAIANPYSEHFTSLILEEQLRDCYRLFQYLGNTDLFESIINKDPLSLLYIDEKALDDYSSVSERQLVSYHLSKSYKAAIINDSLEIIANSLQSLGNKTSFYEEVFDYKEWLSNREEFTFTHTLVLT